MPQANHFDLISVQALMPIYGRQKEFTLAEIYQSALLKVRGQTVTWHQGHIVGKENNYGSPYQEKIQIPSLASIGKSFGAIILLGT
jgi:hypothetical protein